MYDKKMIFGAEILEKSLINGVKTISSIIINTASNEPDKICKLNYNQI